MNVTSLLQVSIKNMLYGTADSEPQTDIVVSQLAQELYNSNMLLLLVQNLSRIDFEGKKDVAQVFNNVLRRQIGTRTPTVEHVCTKPEILFTLMAGYEHQEIALNCGTMLRECARYEALAKIMLYSEEFYNFFQYVEVSTFDIASDAFSTFKVGCELHVLWNLLADFDMFVSRPATDMQLMIDEFTANMELFLINIFIFIHSLRRSS